MAASVTLKTLMEDLVEETGLGTVLPSCTGTTTQLTLANAYAAGPFLAQRFARGSAILTTAGTAINEATFVDTYTPPTGVITHTPSVSGTYTSAILCHFGTGVDHPDRLKEAINRALARCVRKTLVPFTQAGDGADLLGTDADWNTTNATVGYLEGDVLDGRDYGWYLGVNVSATATGGYAVNTSSFDSVQPGDVVDFYTSVEPNDPTAEGRFIIWDDSNGAEVTPTYTEGARATTGQQPPSNVRGFFTAPSGCHFIEYRYVCQTNATSVTFGPLVTAIRGTTQYPISKMITDGVIGNFYTKRFADSGAVSGYSERYEQVLIGHRIDDRRFLKVVAFDYPPPFPLYYEAFIPDAALSSMTASTNVDSRRVLTWAKYELRKMLYEREPDPEKKRQAKVLALEAKKSADRYEFNTTDIVTVAGRR